MSSKYKEYSCIIIMTIVHGIFTYRFLGSMPYISLDVFEGASIKAFIMWLVYNTILYIALQKWVALEKIKWKHGVYAIIFGGISTLIKGCIDLGVGKWSAKSEGVIKIAYIVQITTIIFGILLISILFKFIAQRKICFNIKKVKVPLIIIIIILCSYMVVTGRYLCEYYKIIQIYSSKEEVWRLNYYVGGKILDINVWFYVIFYIVFWWFMRRLTQSPEESRGVKK